MSTELAPRHSAITEWDEHTNGCWIWQGRISPQGYGLVPGGALAHRWVYEQRKGPIPSGLQIDHLCRNRACVNPDHLEPVTSRENTRRGLQGALKTTCAQGHPWIEENIAVKSNGARRCKVCHREAEHARRRSAKGTAR